MNLRARQADCGRQADSGKTTTRVERQANCAPKAYSGKPTAACRQPEWSGKPTAAGRPTAARRLPVGSGNADSGPKAYGGKTDCPEGSGKADSGPKANCGKADSPLLKLNLNRARGRGQRLSWAGGSPRGRSQQSVCQQSPLARGVLRGRRQRTGRQQSPLEAWWGVAEASSPSQQSSMCPLF